MLRQQHIGRALLGATLAVILVASQSAEAKPGYLGVQMQELNDALLEALDLGEGVQGVLVADVEDGSAAAEAGITRGDIIVGIDGKTVESVADVQRRVRAFDAGEKVELQVMRDGKKRAVSVTLAEMQSRQARRANRRVLELGDMPGTGMMFMNPRPMLGVELRELDAEMGKYFGAETGLLVLDVHEDSAAEKAGLRSGDVILSIDGAKTTEVADLHDVLSDKDDGDEVKLGVLREKKQSELTAKIEESDMQSFGRFHRRGHRDGHDSWGGSGPNLFWLDEGLHGRAPRVRLESDDEELREELDRLREELQELRTELEKQREG